MYGIFVCYKQYDYRDVCVGMSSSRLHNNAYQTYGCAWAFVPRNEQEESGCDYERFTESYFVAALAEPWKPIWPPVPLGVGDIADIPF